MWFLSQNREKKFSPLWAMGCCLSAVPVKELLLLINLLPPILVAVSLSRESLKWKVPPRHYQGEMFSSHKLKSRRGLQNPQAIDFSTVITEEYQHITNRWENNEGKNINHTASKKLLSFSKELKIRLTSKQNFSWSLRVAFAPDVYWRLPFSWQNRVHHFREPVLLKRI